MQTCSIEVGLLRKHACGKPGVAHCLNCDQPLCVEHSVPQLSEAGHKTGKYMCQECTEAAKEHAKSMAAVARNQEAKKLAALDKQAREAAAAPPTPPKKPVAPAAPAQPAAAEAPKEPEVFEFTPKDGNTGYTPRKKDDDAGYKPD